MKNWFIKQGHGLLGVFLVALVAIGTIVVSPLVARVLEHMPGLIYMYTGGKPLESSLVREEVDPLPLETIGVEAASMKALQVPVQNEPTFHELDATKIIPTGHYITDAVADATFSARQAVWRWDSEEDGLGVSVIVLELPTNGWATSVMNVLDHGEAPSGEYPAGATVTSQAESGEEPFDIAGVSFVHDRLFVVLEVGIGPNYIRTAESNSDLIFDPSEVARVLSLEVDNNLPNLPDLEGWETVPMEDQRPLHAASLGVAATLVLLTRSFGARFLDRGSREAIFGPLRRRYLAPKDRDIDIRKSTRRLRFYEVLKITGVAVLAGACIIVFYFATAGLGLVAMFIWIGVAFSLASLVPILVSRFQKKTWRLPGKLGWLELTAAILSTMIISAGIFCVGTAAIGFATGDHPLLRLVAIIALFVGLGITGYSALPAKYARRLAMSQIKTALQADTRPPILFLRSFQDDDIYIRVGSKSRRNQIEKLALMDETTFEDHIAWVASRFGPVTAIGQPGTVLQPLGAARDYFDDDSWQTAVLQRLNRATGVVYVVGRSPGAQWELAQILSRGVLGKTVFVFPPLSTNEFMMRSIVLAAGLKTNPGQFFGDLNDGAALVAVRIGESGEIIRYLADGRDEIAYETALSDALTAATQSTTIVTAAKPEYSDPVLNAEAEEYVESYNPRRRRFEPTDPFRQALSFAKNFVGLPG